MCVCVCVLWHYLKKTLVATWKLKQFSSTGERRKEVKRERERGGFKERKSTEKELLRLMKNVWALNYTKERCSGSSDAGAVLLQKWLHSYDATMTVTVLDQVGGQ